MSNIYGLDNDRIIKIPTHRMNKKSSMLTTLPTETPEQTDRSNCFMAISKMILANYGNNILLNPEHVHHIGKLQVIVDKDLYVQSRRPSCYQ